MQKNWKKDHKTQNVEMHPFLQIHDEKVEFRVGSRVGSLANVKVSQCFAILLCFLDVDVDHSLVGQLTNVKVST